MVKIKKLEVHIMGDNQIWASLVYDDVSNDIMKDLAVNIDDFIKELLN